MNKYDHQEKYNRWWLGQFCRRRNLKSIPRVRVPIQFDPIRKLSLKLSVIRASEYVDIFTDDHTRIRILKAMIKGFENLGHCHIKTDSTCRSGSILLYDAYHLDGVTLSVFTDPWFNDIRIARRKRHISSTLALAIQMSDIDFITAKVLHPKFHRLILFH